MTTRRLVPALTVALAVAATVPAAASPHAATAAGATVVLKNIDFSRKTVRIARGQAVTWIWRDGTTPHNVTSVGHPRFRSSTSKQRGTYRVRFTRPGTYRYVCTIHANMRARVIVR